MKYTLLILCALVLTACGGTPATPPAPEKQAATPVEEGSGTIAAPEIGAVDETAIAKILEEHKGKVIVLNFWATWCPPCVEEMPDFVKFYNEMDRDNVAFVSLSGDDPGLIEKDVRKFQQDKKLPFPISVLKEVNPNALHEALRTEISGALPTTLIYNREGAVVEHWEGQTTFEALQAAVKPLVTS